ncbi:MAG: DinB family protein [Acidobacteriaceae bacterium]
MKTFVAALLLCFVVQCAAQQQQKQTPTTLKSILLQQLRETHNEKNWFVSAKEAAGGITPEQAAWNDGKNHSVGQLVHHLAFWNAQTLAQFKGEKAEQPKNNDETFQFDPKQWNATVQHFDDVMTQLENFVSSADDGTLAKIAPTVARISQHNAYHIGEIVMVRKAQGSWNPENGVK